MKDALAPAREAVGRSPRRPLTEAVGVDPLAGLRMERRRGTAGRPRRSDRRAWTALARCEAGQPLEVAFSHRRLIGSYVDHDAQVLVVVGRATLEEFRVRRDRFEWWTPLPSLLVPGDLVLVGEREERGVVVAAGSGQVRVELLGGEEVVDEGAVRLAHAPVPRPARLRVGPGESAEAQLIAEEVARAEDLSIVDEGPSL